MSDRPVPAERERFDRDDQQALTDQAIAALTPGIRRRALAALLSEPRAAAGLDFEVDQQRLADNLPDALLGTYFYQPSAQGNEQQVAERLARWREYEAARHQALGQGAFQPLHHRHKQLESGFSYRPVSACLAVGTGHSFHADSVLPHGN